jgi:hypothetical protein
MFLCNNEEITEMKASSALTSFPKPCVHKIIFQIILEKLVTLLIEGSQPKVTVT